MACYIVTPEMDKYVFGSPKKFINKRAYLKWRATMIAKDNPASYTTINTETYVGSRILGRNSTRSGAIVRVGGKSKFVPMKKVKAKKRWS